MDSTKIAFSRECRRRSARDADARPFHTAWALSVGSLRRSDTSGAEGEADMWGNCSTDTLDPFETLCLPRCAPPAAI